MKKVKKYYPGTSGLVYDNSKSVGVLAPQKEDPNKFSTGKFLFPEQKTLGKIVDRKVMSQDYLSSKGPSFMDKAGSFMGNYGDIIGSVGTSIASLINANKKQDPTGRPYKKGTNMIKYQEGTKSAKNMEYILEQNRINNAMNTILVANAANAKRNAELNSRVAPKKLEGKKANVKTDSLKTNKPSLVKYQAGAEEIIGPGPLDNLPQMSPEQLKAFNAYDSKKEIAEAIERVNKMGAPVSPLTPRMASIPTAQIPTMSPKMSSNVAPVQKQSRRERKAENERLFKMTRKDESPIEPLMPKMARLSSEIPTMQPNLKKVEVETPAKKIKYFDYTTKEAKGGYSRALKSGKTTKEGWLIDPETGLVYKDLRKDKASSKSPIKMKESTVLPGLKSGRPIYTFDTVIEDNKAKTQKGVEKPKLTQAQIDSAINSINLPKFKGKNTLHPLEYRSK
jgi:hypothetical protein